MGTRWRGLLAPINKPTGDGRRMAAGAFRSRQLPLALKWQRVDDQGHDASVVIGLMDKLTIDETAGEVWGEGELFDDQPNLPRLTQDVAEAMLLTSKKVVGPSVDAGAAEMVFVREGTDTPLTDQDWEQLMWEEMETGIPAPIEMLFTDYEIAAATLVVIPAFAEARPFELLGTSDTTETVPADEAPVTAAARERLVLTAAAGVTTVSAEVFTPPAEAPPYQMLTVQPPREGEPFRRVAGYAAAFGTCHVQHRDVCLTPPPSSTGYALFHRHPLNTDEGLLAVGRLTTGHGLVGTGCAHLAHRGKDDHACDDMTLVQALAHYDRLTTVAWVHATEYDGVGIWVQGVLAADATDRDLAVLARQRVSGDWRDHGGHLEMVELLALAREREGFPIPRTSLRNGRQVTLTAAGALPPRSALAAGPAAGWAGGLATRIADLVVKGMRGADLNTGTLYAVPVTAAAGDQPTEPVEVPVDSTPAAVHTGAMVALVPSEQDAARLAVDGGEPAEELHMTLLYLGEADQIDAASRQAIIDACTKLAAEWQASAGGELQIVGDGFAVSKFNGAAEDKQTAVVLGVSGEQMTAAHTQVADAVKAVFGYPAQHEPWVAHVTLTYTDEPGTVDALTDRAGPVQFDRLRVAFAGAAHDIRFDTDTTPQPDGEDMPTPGEPADAAALIGEVEAALAAVDADERARAAAVLQRQIEEVGADV